MGYIEGGIRKYIEDLAARMPAPGGGSAAGLVGAAGVALLEMVCNFTLGNEKYKGHHGEIEKHLRALEKTRADLLALVDDDVRVYSSIRSVFKTRDEKDIDKALKEGYYVSDKICRLSKDSMQIAVGLAEKGNRNLITDVGCGAEFLFAAFNSGVFNGRINLKGIKDRVFVEKETINVDGLKKEAAAIYKKVISKTQEALA